MTGLMLNEAKTLVMPIHQSQIPLGFDEIGFTNGTELKILGHTLDNKGSVLNNSRNSIIRRLMYEVNKWKKLDLSLKGRLNITKCYLLSQINYQGLLANFEHNDINMFETIIANYVKTGTNISIKAVFKKISEGGLGIPKISSMLLAQRARLWTLAVTGGDHWRTEALSRMGGINLTGLTSAPVCIQS